MEKVEIKYELHRGKKPEKYIFRGKNALIEAQKLLENKYNGDVIKWVYLKKYWMDRRAEKSVYYYIRVLCSRFSYGSNYRRVLKWKEKN